MLEAVQTLRSLEPSQMQASPQMGNLIIITGSSCSTHDNSLSVMCLYAMLHSQHLQFDYGTVPFILCSKKASLQLLGLFTFNQTPNRA